MAQNCLCSTTEPLQNSQRASSGCAFSWSLYIYTPGAYTQIQVYISLQPNCIQNYKRMKRFVYSDVLIQDVSSQTYNLAEHLASHIEQLRCGYKRDSLSCTLHYRVPGYGRDLFIRELLLKIKIVSHTAARLVFRVTWEPLSLHGKVAYKIFP